LDSSESRELLKYNYDIFKASKQINLPSMTTKSCLAHSWLTPVV